MKRISEEEQGGGQDQVIAGTDVGHVQLKECAQRGDRSYGNNIRGKMLTVRTMSCRKPSYGQADNVVTLQMMCGKRKITSSSVDQSRRRKMCAPTGDFDSICAAWGS